MPVTQRATFEATLQPSSSSSNVCPWSRPWTSLEIHLRDDCSAWAHIIWLSLVVDTLLFVGMLTVCDTVCLQKNFLVTEKFWGAIIFKMGKFCCCYQTIFEIEYTLGWYWKFYTWSRLSTGCRRQFRFAFVQEDDISHRWSMIRESADTTHAKGHRHFSKEPHVHLLLTTQLHNIRQ